MVKTNGIIGRDGSPLPLSRFSRNQKDEKKCHWEGCPHEAEFRAPKSRTELNEYVWFCLEHIRLYNASWNYYEGMSDEEVEADRRNDVTWNRPAWKFGSQRLAEDEGLIDPLGVYEENIGPFCRKNGAGTLGNPRPRPHSPEELALSTLDLNWPLTVKKLKSQYKKLVKIHHPDTNDGDKQAEERFKSISQAYSTLLSYLENEKVNI